MSSWQQRANFARLDLLSTPIMRGAAWTIAVLLLTGYLTGEEVQHTHALLGYGLAAVLIATVFWELMRPHEHRASGVSTGVTAARAAFTTPSSSQFGGPALIASALMLLVGLLALIALAMLWLAHSLWTAVDVDEAHEAIAYLSLGLAVFFVLMVIFGSSQETVRRLRIPRDSAQ